jgi:hypothetical protein
MKKWRYLLFAIIALALFLNFCCPHTPKCMPSLCVALDAAKTATSVSFEGRLVVPNKYEIKKATGNELAVRRVFEAVANMPLRYWGEPAFPVGAGSYGQLNFKNKAKTVASIKFINSEIRILTSDGNWDRYTWDSDEKSEYLYELLSVDFFDDKKWLLCEMRRLENRK